MIKYKVEQGVWNTKILKKEVVRESESCVWFENGRYERKETTNQRYFDSFEEAKAHAIALVGKQVTNYRNLMKDQQKLEDKFYSLMEEDL
jgi:hypothetical protein